MYFLHGNEFGPRYVKLERLKEAENIPLINIWGFQELPLLAWTRLGVKNHKN